MKEKIINKLEPLINKPVWYSNKQVTITKYIFDDDRDRVFIHFKEIGPMDRPIDTAMHLIDTFQPIPQIHDIPSSTDVTTPGVGTISIPFLDNTGVLDKVTDILLQDIEDIKAGKIELDKAEARSRNIDQIIDIQKTKVAQATIVAKLMGK